MHEVEQTQSGRQHDQAFRRFKARHYSQSKSRRHV
jgi:hypothetical protein